MAVTTIQDIELDLSTLGRRVLCLCNVLRCLMFKAVNIGDFYSKTCDDFQMIALNIDYGNALKHEVVLSSTHHVCFVQTNRKM